MRVLVISLIMMSVLPMVGCTKTVNSPKMSCVGWKQITLQAGTAGYMSKNDSVAAREVLSHNLYGKSLGCWA